MSLEKFSKNLQDFVGELNLTFPETPIADDAFDVVSEEHMETFLTEMEPFMTEVSRIIQLLLRLRNSCSIRAFRINSLFNIILVVVLQRAYQLFTYIIFYLSVPYEINTDVD